MTQEDKELLIKDICGRLPYGVKAQVYNHWRDEVQDETITIENLHQLIETFSIGDIKPYLFPLSSMTYEQKEEHQSLIDNHYSFDANGNVFTLQDFYCKNHIDYRSLIPMGLANDATGLNIY